MLNQIITSQEFIDADIVAAKIAAGDFEIYVSPEFQIDGETFRVLMDGHHSFAAAIEAGVVPIINEMTVADSDTVELLNNGNIDDFLAACWMDREYHFATTGKSVW